MTPKKFKEIEKRYKEAEKRFEQALEIFDKEQAASSLKLRKVLEHLNDAQREFNWAKNQIEEEKIMRNLPKKTVSDLAYQKYQEQERERNEVAEDFFKTLIPEVDYIKNENPNLTLEEACKEVINDSGWEAFHYNIFIHLTEQQFPDHLRSTEWRSFLEDLEEFMDLEAPKMLKKAYEKANPTGWVALPPKQG